MHFETDCSHYWEQTSENERCVICGLCRDLLASGGFQTKLSSTSSSSHTTWQDSSTIDLHEICEKLHVSRDLVSCTLTFSDKLAASNGFRRRKLTEEFLAACFFVQLLKHEYQRSPNEICYFFNINTKDFLTLFNTIKPADVNAIIPSHEQLFDQCACRFPELNACGKEHLRRRVEEIDRLCPLLSGFPQKTIILTSMYLYLRNAITRKHFCERTKGGISLSALSRSVRLFQNQAIDIEPLPA